MSRRDPTVAVALDAWRAALQRLRVARAGKRRHHRLRLAARRAREGYRRAHRRAWRSWFGADVEENVFPVDAARHLRR